MAWRLVSQRVRQRPSYPTSSSTVRGCRSYTTTQLASQFPYEDSSFASVFSPKNNFWYVDKTDYIRKLEALRTPAVVALRNRGMGKSLWTDTLAHYYDIDKKDKFEELFGHLAIGKNPTSCRNTYYVLPLNFSGLKTDTVEDFKSSFKDYLNGEIKSFKERYKLPLHLDEQDTHHSFSRLVSTTKITNRQLYIIIDEYDMCINKALDELPFVSASEKRRESLQRIEDCYCTFFSMVKTACDSNVAQCFITGVFPLALCYPTGDGFNIAWHLTRDLRFTSLWGFSEADVRNGLARLPQLGPEVIERIITSWRREFGGYYFNLFQKEEPVYNPACVLFGLRELERILHNDPPQLSLSSPSSSIQPEQVAIHLLQRIKNVPNPMPAKTMLDAIRSNPHGSTVIAEAISSDNAELKWEDQGLWRLYRMDQLARSTTSLKTFMAHHGALTEVPISYWNDPKRALRIPNNLARVELERELQETLLLDETALNSLRNGLLTMLETKDMDSLCKELSNFLPPSALPDERHSIADEEGFLRLNIYYAFVLCRRAIDRVEKNFHIDPASRGNYLIGSTADIVYIQNPSEEEGKPAQYYVFSFKNIPVQGLLLAKSISSSLLRAHKKEDIQDNWDKLCGISHEHLDEAMVDDILALPLNPYFSNVKFSDQSNSTVQTVIDKAEEGIRAKYAPSLQKEFGKDNTHFWVLVRVGMKRIIAHKVTCALT